MLISAPPTIDEAFFDELKHATMHGVDLLDNGKFVAMLIPSRSKNVWEPITGKYQYWSTITPIILHSSDSVNGMVKPPRRDKEIRRAFRKRNMTDIIHKFGSSPEYPERFNSSSINISHYRVTGSAKHLKNLPWYHITVAFKEPVHGPIMVGRGTLYGFGLLGGIRATE